MGSENPTTRRRRSIQYVTDRLDQLKEAAAVLNPGRIRGLVFGSGNKYYVAWQPEADDGKMSDDESVIAPQSVQRICGDDAVPDAEESAVFQDMPGVGKPEEFDLPIVLKYDDADE